MAKKNLKDKIIEAAFWTSFFLVVYLIVGFLLGSSWLSKGLTFDESYNLLKDALSITAAFLAPVAAFVLFSDWREQHEAKLIEHTSTQIFGGVIDLYEWLLALHSEIEDGDFDSNEIKYIFRELKNKTKEIRVLNLHLSGTATGEKFAKCASEVVTDIANLSIELSALYGHRVKMSTPEQYYKEHTETTPEEYVEYIENKFYNPLLSQITRSYPEIDKSKDLLGRYCDELKIKSR